MTNSENDEAAPAPVGKSLSVGDTHNSVDGKTRINALIQARDIGTVNLTTSGQPLRRMRRRPLPHDVQLSRIEDELALRLKDQWEREAGWRRLYDPYTLSVPWHPADPGLFVDWSTLPLLLRSPGWPAPSSDDWANGANELSGAGEELAAVFERVPTGRLVLLGRPGAGKTILLVRLLLDLLSRRQPGQSVPVLIPLASWNPNEIDLYTWVERWLCREYEALAVRGHSGSRRSLARELLDNGSLVLLLDGLDELPEQAGRQAIGAINEALRPGHRLVLASRTEAYRAMVRASTESEVLLSGAVGVELDSISFGAVVEYLKQSTGPIGAARWEEMATTVEHTTSAVACALRTPLMAALARAVYNPRPGEEQDAAASDPRELLDTRRFSSVSAVEHHLFDRFVPSAYRRRHGHSERRREWNPDKARRWLTYLARDLEERQNGATDLAWWRLTGAAGWIAPSILVALMGGLAGAIGYSFPTDRGYAISSGFGMVITVLVGLLARPLFGSVDTGIGKALAGGLFGGLCGGLLSVALYGFGHTGTNVGTFIGGGLGFGTVAALCNDYRSAAIGAFTGETASAAFSFASFAGGTGRTHGRLAVLTNGLGVAVVAGAAMYVALSLAVGRLPARGVRWSSIGLLLGAGCGIAVGFTTWYQFGARSGLIVGLVATVAGMTVGFLFGSVPTDLAVATTPRSVLTRDRAAHYLSWLGLGVPYGLATGLTIGVGRTTEGGYNGLRLGLGVGLANLVVVGGLFALNQAAWGPFSVTRYWLAARGRLPWCLMRFLEDAHEQRGVMRQVGATYQFRHREIQRRLAEVHDPE